MKVFYEIDTTHFERTFREYMQWSSRSFTQACNEKAFFIARRAPWETHKASEQELRTIFGQAVKLRIKKRGKGFAKTRNTSIFTGTYGDSKAPRLALIINARRGKKSRGGKGGLYGAEMEREMNKVFGARIRSIAFIRSGWIPAARKLEPFSKYKRQAPPEDKKSKVFGVPKGGAKEAKWNHSNPRIEAKIWNSVGGGKKQPGRQEAVVKYGQIGLDNAFEFERKSMKEYIENKMNADAARFNSTT